MVSVMKAIELMRDFQELYPKIAHESLVFKNLIKAVKEEEADKHKEKIKEYEEILAKIRVLLPSSHSGEGG